MLKVLTCPVLLTALLFGSQASAQGTIRGAEEGAARGEREAGPLGGLIGGAVGAATGTIGGILGIDDRDRFRDHVRREGRPSHVYREEYRVGSELPEGGITYYDVPREYGAASGYRYTVLNGHTVLVDRRTRRVVEVLD